MLRVGISQRVYLCPRTNEIRDCLDSRWYDFLNIINIIPIPIPNNINVDSFLSSIKFDGFILSGGNNINIKNKIESERNMLTNLDISDVRDNVEKKIIDLCVDEDLPLIGVCRGMQMINSYFGGNLIKVEKDKHVDSYHEVNFKKSIFSDIYGYTKKLNSYHNFGINKQNISIKLTSLGNSGKSIECFKHKKKNIHGIMWHPERHSPFFDEDLNFFKKTLK